MKFTNGIITFALAAAVLATGCEKEKIDFSGGQNPDSETGWLVLSGMNVNVNADAETIESRAEDKKTVEAPDDYGVTITRASSQETVLAETYGAIKRRTEPIALQPGQYRVTAKSANADNIALADWDCPAYTGSVTATVTKNITTQAPTVVCKLANIKTSVFFTDLLKSKFRETPEHPLQVTAKLGESKLVFGRNETRTGYFKALQTVNNLEVTLTGEYNTSDAGAPPVYKVVSMTQTVDNVRAGQWRKLTFAIQVSDEGNVTFSVQVDTWVDDAPIEVDAMSLYACGEETIPDDGQTSDPDSPILTLDNRHDIAEPFLISSAIFDDEGTCTDRIGLILTPNDDAVVTSVAATFSSDNEELTAALAAAGYENGAMDITEVLSVDGVDYTTVGVSGRAKVIRATSAAMRKLFEFAGTHKVRIAAADSKNRTSYTDLTVTVRRGGAAENGPSIVWRDHDIDRRYVANDLSGDDCCVIDIASASGITGFLVDIGGTVLSPSDLRDMGLDSHMDLIAPATDAMDGMLHSLGFKTKDEVRGAKELQFNISQFVPMLTALGIPGPVDFKLTVTDGEGSVAKTVMFTVK